MHGQTKRRKRTIEGLLAVDGNKLVWSLMSEPQWTTDDGYIGLRISVQKEDACPRELICNTRFLRRSQELDHRNFRQRPKFSAKTVEASVRQAIAAGWDPTSRGKPIVFQVPTVTT
jgi:hypothetical protein